MNTHTGETRNGGRFVRPGLILGLVQFVKDTANENMNAKVDFGDFDLTLFSSFPA